MWRLDPPLPDDVDSRPLAVAVGSDDPDAQARDWLERVRRRGLESRSTRPADEVTSIEDLPNPLRDYPSHVL